MCIWWVGGMVSFMYGTFCPIPWSKRRKTTRDVLFRRCNEKILERGNKNRNFCVVKLVIKFWKEKFFHRKSVKLLRKKKYRDESLTKAFCGKNKHGHFWKDVHMFRKQKFENSFWIFQNLFQLFENKDLLKSNVAEMFSSFRNRAFQIWFRLFKIEYSKTVFDVSKSKIS